MLFELILNHAPEKIALRDETQSVRYGDLGREVQNRVEALDGVSVLAIALDNSVDWVLWDLAALKAGTPCVPVPPFFTPEQIFHSLQSAGVTHILSPEGLRNTGTERKDVLPKGTAKVTFTSGTTGTPKGVCLPRSAMENVAGSIVEVLGNEFAGTHASVLPLAVLLENVAGLYAGLIAGCAIELTGLNNFGQNYEHLHNVLKSSKATSVILVPEILRVLMAQIAIQGALPDLKFIAVGGSKIDPALVMQARSIGLPVYEGYGLSECASVVSLNTPKEDKPGSVGKLLAHVKARIVNGEIQIENPGFLGYVSASSLREGNADEAIQRPQEKSLGCFADARNDVFATGDLGDFDEDGFLSVTGRKKNVLITSYGRNVSPEWVESVLLAHPAIAQAVVYGDAQPHLSAILVPSSAQANIQSAVNTANHSLPDYAQIKDFKTSSPFTVEGGLLTGTGRPRREQILNLYTKEKPYELLRSTG
ncbi:MAG: AMP-binding protein [Rhodospirillales bacterium]|nr:AMP-binding protein [Rhodospirillales bacterium]